MLSMDIGSTCFKLIILSKNCLDACLFYLNAYCIFFPLIYLFTFFWYEMDDFLNLLLLFFFVEKLLYFNGCYSTWMMMAEKWQRLKNSPFHKFLDLWTSA